MIEKGTLYKRRVVTVFNVLEDFGGIEEAIVLAMAPFVATIAQRSFKYNLVAKHMKIKKRNKGRPQMPTESVNELGAKAIFKLAGINNIQKWFGSAFQMICCPSFCHMTRKSRNLNKILNRGHEQYEEATDVLAMIRMQHRLKLLESLVFNEGQLALASLHKSRYLKTASSSSDSDPALDPDSD